MKKEIYIFIVSFLMSAAAYGMQGNLLTFQNNTNVVITSLCVQSNGDPCTSSNTCSLTAYYPNISIIANASSMLFSKAGFFNYSPTSK